MWPEGTFWMPRHGACTFGSEILLHRPKEFDGTEGWAVLGLGPLLKIARDRFRAVGDIECLSWSYHCQRHRVTRIIGSSAPEALSLSLSLLLVVLTAASVLGCVKGGVFTRPSHLTCLNSWWRADVPEVLHPIVAVVQSRTFSILSLQVH